MKAVRFSIPTKPISWFRSRAHAARLRFIHPLSGGKPAKEETEMAKIMIVDDAAFMRKVIKQMLMELGHEIVAEAANGVEAITIYERIKPDLITLDITMPEMNGIEVAKELRKINPKALIIMCSAMGQKTMIIEAIQAGAKDFVVKPIQKDRLHTAVSKALS
jgi:two-component system chemotaxis response regulator CheY